MKKLYRKPDLKSRKIDLGVFGNYGGGGGSDGTNGGKQDIMPNPIEDIQDLNLHME